MAEEDKEEERKDVSGPKPSLPSNYVTLAQLQERWLKEQARKKQIQEENDQLHRERQQLELEQLEREKAELDRKNRQEYDVVINRDQNEVAVRRRNDRRHQNRRRHHQAEESRIESAVADDVAKIRDESEQMTKRKPKRNKKKRREPRVEGSGGTNQVEPEEGKVEKVQVNVKEGTRKINGGTIEVERDEGKVEKVKVKEGADKINGKFRGDHRKNRLVWEEKRSSASLPLHQMVEGLSVNGGKEEGSNDYIKKGSRWLKLREPREDGGKERNVSSLEGSNGHNRNRKGYEWSESRGRGDDDGKERNVSSQDGSNGHHRNGSNRGREGMITLGGLKKER